MSEPIHKDKETYKGGVEEDAVSSSRSIEETRPDPNNDHDNSRSRNETSTTTTTTTTISSDPLPAVGASPRGWDNYETTTNDPPHAAGAFRMRGPSGRGGHSDDDSSEEVVLAADDEGEENTGAPASHDNLVHAYVVQEGGDPVSDDQDRVHANLPRAEIVSKSKSRLVALAVILVGTIAVVFFFVFFNNRNKRNLQQDNDSDDDLLLASYQCQDVMVMQAEIRQTGVFENSTVSSGSFSTLFCYVEPCQEEPVGSCDIRKRFDPTHPCCVGLQEDGCLDDERCGALCFTTEVCEFAPESCQSKECAVCEKDYKGDNPFIIENVIVEFDCVHAGRAIRRSNGEPYNWMIMCGPITYEARHGHLAPGEWVCTAVRSGAGFSDENGGIFSDIPSCKFIQHAECGCLDPNKVPVDWLPPPTGQCLTPDDGCPFLCEDAGQKYVRDLCYKFPGDIEWWEGANALQVNAFATNVVVRDLRRGCEVKLKDDFYD